MNQMQTIATAPDHDDEGAFSLIDTLIVFAKHKKLIIGLPLATAIAAAAISMAMPNHYKANTKLLPPQQAQSGAAAMLTQLGGVADVAAGAAAIKSRNDLYVGMLKSRTVADRLIKALDLKKVYETSSPEKARKILEKNTSVSAGKDGLITIEVTGEDKKLVARIANTYVAELLTMTKAPAVTEASQRRVFFEQQLELSKDNLAKAEMTLKSALDKNGVISVDSDSRALVEMIGRLRAQISAKEIERKAMHAFVTTNNADFKRTQQELDSLHAELSLLESGKPAEPVPGREGPNKQVGLENIKIVRDVKYHQILYELLSKQYEVARLDEAKDTAVMQVLDPAVEPEEKSGPMRALIVLLSTMVAFLLAVVAAFILDVKEKALQRPDRLAQWQEMKNHLRWK